MSSDTVSGAELGSRRPAERCGEDAYVRDARRLSAAGLEDLRRSAVAAVESGVPRAEVARRYGISRQAVGAWVSAYRREGPDALRPRRRGRRPGAQLALTPAQQLWVVRAVTTSTPDAMGLEHSLWTCRSVAELVDRQYGTGLGAATIRNYLIRWGFRVDHPVWARAGARPVSAYGLQVRSRSVAAGPRTTSNETVWTDRTRVRWSVPVTDSAHGREPGISHESDVFLAVSSRGVKLFMATHDPYDGGEVREFFRRLLMERGRRVTIVSGWWPKRRVDLLESWVAANT